MCRLLLCLLPMFLFVVPVMLPAKEPQQETSYFQMADKHYRLGPVHLHFESYSPFDWFDRSVGTGVLLSAIQTLPGHLSLLNLRYGTGRLEPSALFLSQLMSTGLTAWGAYTLSDWLGQMGTDLWYLLNPVGSQLPQIGDFKAKHSNETRGGQPYFQDRLQMVVGNDGEYHVHVPMHMYHPGGYLSLVTSLPELIKVPALSPKLNKISKMASAADPASLGKPLVSLLAKRHTLHNKGKIIGLMARMYPAGSQDGRSRSGHEGSPDNAEADHSVSSLSTSLQPYVGSRRPQETNSLEPRSVPVMAASKTGQGNAQSGRGGTGGEQERNLGYLPGAGGKTGSAGKPAPGDGTGGGKPPPRGNGGEDPRGPLPDLVPSSRVIFKARVRLQSEVKIVRGRSSWPKDQAALIEMLSTVTGIDKNLLFSLDTRKIQLINAFDKIGLRVVRSENPGEYFRLNDFHAPQMNIGELMKRVEKVHQYHKSQGRKAFQSEGDIEKATEIFSEATVINENWLYDSFALLAESGSTRACYLYLDEKISEYIQMKRGKGRGELAPEVYEEIKYYLGIFKGLIKPKVRQQQAVSQAAENQAPDPAASAPQRPPPFFHAEPPPGFLYPVRRPPPVLSYFAGMPPPGLQHSVRGPPPVFPLSVRVPVPPPGLQHPVMRPPSRLQYSVRMTPAVFPHSVRMPPAVHPHFLRMPPAVHPHFLRMPPPGRQHPVRMAPAVLQPPVNAPHIPPVAMIQRQAAPPFSVLNVPAQWLSARGGQMMPVPYSHPPEPVITVPPEPEPQPAPVREEDIFREELGEAYNLENQEIEFTSALVDVSEDGWEKIILDAVVQFNEEAESPSERAVLTGGRAAWWYARKYNSIDFSNHRNRGWSNSKGEADIGDWDLRVQDAKVAEAASKKIQREIKAERANVRTSYFVNEQAGKYRVTVVFDAEGKERRQSVDIFYGPYEVTQSPDESEVLPVTELEDLSDQLEALMQVAEKDRNSARLEQLKVRRELLQGAKASLNRERQRKAEQTIELETITELETGTDDIPSPEEALPRHPSPLLTAPGLSQKNENPVIPDHKASQDSGETARSGPYSESGSVSLHLQGLSGVSSSEANSLRYESTPDDNTNVYGASLTPESGESDLNVQAALPPKTVASVSPGSQGHQEVVKRVSDIAEAVAAESIVKSTEKVTSIEKVTLASGSGRHRWSNVRKAAPARPVEASGVKSKPSPVVEKTVTRELNPARATSPLAVKASVSQVEQKKATSEAAMKETFLPGLPKRGKKASTELLKELPDTSVSDSSRPGPEGSDESIDIVAPKKRLAGDGAEVTDPLPKDSLPVSAEKPQTKPAVRKPGRKKAEKRRPVTAPKSKTREGVKHDKKPGSGQRVKTRRKKLSTGQPVKKAVASVKKAAETVPETPDRPSTLKESPVRSSPETYEEGKQQREEPQNTLSTKEIQTGEQTEGTEHNGHDAGIEHKEEVIEREPDQVTEHSPAESKGDTSVAESTQTSDNPKKTSKQLKKERKQKKKQPGPRRKKAKNSTKADTDTAVVSVSGEAEPAAFQPSLPETVAQRTMDFGESLIEPSEHPHREEPEDKLTGGDKQSLEEKRDSEIIKERPSSKEPSRSRSFYPEPKSKPTQNVPKNWYQAMRRPDDRFPLGLASISYDSGFSIRGCNSLSECRLGQFLERAQASLFVDGNVDGDTLHITVEAGAIKELESSMPVAMATIPDLAYLSARLLPWDINSLALFQKLYSARYFHQTLPYLFSILLDQDSIFFNPYLMAAIFKEVLAVDYPDYRFYESEFVPDWSAVPDPVKAIIQLFLKLKTASEAEKKKLYSKNNKWLAKHSQETGLMEGVIGFFNGMGLLTETTAKGAVEHLRRRAETQKGNWLLYRLQQGSSTDAEERLGRKKKYHFHHMDLAIKKVSGDRYSHYQAAIDSMWGELHNKGQTDDDDVSEYSDNIVVYHEDVYLKPYVLKEKIEDIYQGEHKDEVKDDIDELWGVMDSHFKKTHLVNLHHQWQRLRMGKLNNAEKLHYCSCLVNAAELTGEESYTSQLDDAVKVCPDLEPKVQVIKNKERHRQDSSVNSAVHSIAVYRSEQHSPLCFPEKMNKQINQIRNIYFKQYGLTQGRSILNYSFQPVTSIQNLQGPDKNSLIMGVASLLPGPSGQSSSEAEFVEWLTKMSAQYALAGDVVYLAVDAGSVESVLGSVEDLTIPELAYLKARLHQWEPENPEFVRLLFRARHHHEMFPHLVAVMLNPKSPGFQPFLLKALREEVLLAGYPATRRFALENFPVWRKLSEQEKGMVQLLLSSDSQRPASLKPITSQLMEDVLLYPEKVDVNVGLLGLHHSLGGFTEDESDQVAFHLLKIDPPPSIHVHWLVSQMVSASMRSFIAPYLQPGSGVSLQQTLDMALEDPDSPHAPDLFSISTQMLGDDPNARIMPILLNHRLYLNPLKMQETLDRLAANDKQQGSGHGLEERVSDVMDAMKKELALTQAVNLHLQFLLLRLDELDEVATSNFFKRLVMAYRRNRSSHYLDWLRELISTPLYQAQAQAALDEIGVTEALDEADALP